MYLPPYRKISRKERIKSFISSYNGVSAGIGILFFIIYCIFPNIGGFFEAIALSIVASTIFYFITNFFPRHKKRKIVEPYIIKWLQQLQKYGEWVLEDISGEKNCSKEQFKTAATDIDLKTMPNNNISKRENRTINTWFEYFDNFLKYEDIYIQQIVKYSDYIPVEILIKFEEYKQFDNFRNAISRYKNNYNDKSYNYKYLSGFSDVVWSHAKSLTELPELYIKHIYSL